MKIRHIHSKHLQVTVDAELEGTYVRLSEYTGVQYYPKKYWIKLQTDDPKKEQNPNIIFL